VIKYFALVVLVFLLFPPASLALVDTNNNGLSDYWEREFNAGELLPGSFDPQADQDGDGWSNVEEAAAGTNPNDPNPPAGIIHPEIIHTPAVFDEQNGDPVIVTPEAVSVSWHTIPGKQYTLFIATGMEPESWIVVDEPFLGSGSTPEFHFESPDGEKSFWRVAVTDVDSDADTLTNAEEHKIGTHPFLRDSDADGLDDHLDPQPNSGIPTFPDGDGDGIADGDDPDNLGGVPPAITCDSATTARIVNVAAGEDLEFFLTVENPDGPPVAASDLKLFVSGAEDNAIFTPLGDNVFEVVWTARIHDDYPEKLLQSLMVRFQDSRMATAWIELARLDVAEWQGMLAGLTVSYNNIHTRTFSIGGHSSGIRMEPSPWSGAYGLGPRWYRGPREISFYGRNTEEAPPGADVGTLSIGEGMRYPMFIIADTDSPPAPATTVIDISNPVQYPHGFWGLNQWSGAIQLEGTGATSTIELATANYFPLPQPLEQDAPYSFEAKFSQNGQWLSALHNIWSVPAWTSSRSMHALTATASNTSGVPTILNWSNFVPVEARIVASAAGSITRPGLPLDYMLEQRPLFMTPSRWHRIVVKVGPDVAVVARGVRLRLNVGATGEESPQAGFDFKRWTATGSVDFTPGDLLETSDLFNDLTGPDGLVLFARMGPEITRLHRLTLDLLPNGTTLEPFEYRKLELVPVAVHDNHTATGVDLVSITADPSDTGYQPKFWIMAPAGNDPSGNPCSNDTRISIPMEPANHLRMDCTLAQCKYRHPVNDDGVSSPIPLEFGQEAAVRWLGTGAESGDHTPIYYLGQPHKQVDLPVSVKVMKRRTVKVAVYKVQRPESRPFPNFDESQLLAELNEVFAYQINAWFELKFYTKTISYDTDLNRNLILASGNTEFPGLLGDPQITATDPDFTPDIKVLLIDDIRFYGVADLLNPVPSPLAGYTPPGNVCVVQVGTAWTDGSDDPLVLDKDPATVRQNVAHEIGHVMLGEDHPDLGGGPAPLNSLSPDVRRLMHSGIDGILNAQMLLVKGEWDTAEAWLKRRTNGDY
jgi:hypothetical protein